MPCTLSAIVSASKPCFRDVSSCPPKTTDGRAARIAEVAVAPDAIKSVGLQARRALLLLVQSFFDLLYLVLVPAITGFALRFGSLCGWLRRNFHVINYNCH